MGSGLAEYDIQMKLPSLIMEMEKEYRKLEWWRFITKNYLRQRIQAYRDLGWDIGVAIALNDLKKAGIIKEKA